MNKNDCQELKNIEYKTMLIGSKKNLTSNINNDFDKVDTYLKSEKNTNYNDKVNWNNLIKTDKIKKLELYSNKFSTENNLSKSETKDLKKTLLNYLNHKKFKKIKEIKYNKEIGEIDTIPNLFYNKTTKKFSLKKYEKKSLSSINISKTRKNKLHKDKGLNIITQ